MTEEHLVVIGATSTQKWYIRKEDVDIKQSIIDSLVEGCFRDCINALDLTDRTEGHFGKVSIRSFGLESAWNIRVTRINMNAPFACYDGVFVPRFDDPAAPRMTIPWVVPSNMALTYIVGVSAYDDLCSIAYQYLLAKHEDGRKFSIPISNVFEDCKLCSGQEGQSGNTQLECVIKATRQFINSEWNADLYSSDNELIKTKTKGMFRFKPVDEGFEQLPTAEEDWTLLCTKVSTSELERIAI